MSICTKTGDAGTTGLMYNRRVSKTHPRVEACGAVDELNAAIGVARAASQDEFVRQRLFHIQKELIDLMGEIATDREDLPRYEKDGFRIMGAGAASRLETWITAIESENISFRDWATPGANPEAAALDLARCVARRAERRVQELLEKGDTDNRQLQIYLNRVSDLLWLMARRVETRLGASLSDRPNAEKT